MNRPLLLLICDFLLLSMFALARFDVPPDAVVVDPSAILDDTPADEVSDSGLLSTLEQSLAAEKQLNQSTQKELDQARSQLELTSQNLQSLENQYRETQASLEQVAGQKADTQAEVLKLEDALRQTRTRLTTIQSLSKDEQAKLQKELEKREKDLIVQETRLQEVQLALKQKEEMLQSSIREQAALEQRLVDIEENSEKISQEKELLEEEKLKLASRNRLLDSTIEILKTEKQMIASNLTDARATIAVERKKNQDLQTQAFQLSNNVANLASKSEEMKQEIKEEIRKNTVLSPHEIFSQYISRQVYVRFEYTDGSRDKELVIPSVLFRPSGSNQSWAVFHIHDSPLDARNRISVPDELSVWLQFGTTAVSMGQLVFHPNDPAVVLAPVSIPADYLDVAPEPFDFPDNALQFDECVVIQPVEQNYGTIKFSIFPGLTNLIRLQDGGVLSNLLGNFNARRGNILFSRGGDFLGIMRSGNESILLENFSATNIMRVGRQYDAATARQLLEAFFQQNASGGVPSRSLLQQP